MVAIISEQERLPDVLPLLAVASTAVHTPGGRRSLAGVSSGSCSHELDPCPAQLRSARNAGNTEMGAFDHTSGSTPDADRETGLSGRADEWPADGGAGGCEAFDGLDPRQPAGTRTGEVPPLRIEQRSPAEILQPNGDAIGEPGSSPGIRELSGGEREAEELYEQLSAEGEEVQPSGYPGRAVELPDGGFVGLRLESKSGGPAIDVNISGIDITRIHFR